MQTIYERTRTTVSEVLRSMIIRPKYIQINNKKYGYEINKDYLQGHYDRKITFVKNLKYDASTQILVITVKGDE